MTPKFEGPRAARPREIPVLLRLLDRVFRPDGRSSIRDEHPYFYAAPYREGLRIMLDRGRIVSHYGVRFWTLDILGVPLRLASGGGVCTDPEYRGHGLATLLLRDSEDLCRQRDVDLIWISGDRGLYLSNGYGYAGRCTTLTADRAFARRARPPAGFSLRLLRAADLPRLARLSDGEPVRFRRPLEELALLFAGRNARSEPDLFRRVTFAGRDLAWINLATFDARRCWKLCDYAGDREAVAAGLALLMRAERIESVTAHVPAWDVALASRLAAAGLRRKDDTFPWHTIKIPDFHRFMELFRPALAERIDARTLAGLRFETRPGGGGAIRAGKHVLALKNPHDLVALVFGVPPARMPAAVRRAPEPVARFIKAALPLPLRFPGLNYV